MGALPHLQTCAYAFIIHSHTTIVPLMISFHRHRTFIWVVFWFKAIHPPEKLTISGFGLPFAPCYVFMNIYLMFMLPTWGINIRYTIYTVQIFGMESSQHRNCAHFFGRHVNRWIVNEALRRQVEFQHRSRARTSETGWRHEQVFEWIGEKLDNVCSPRFKGSAWCCKPDVRQRSWSPERRKELTLESTPALQY